MKKFLDRYFSITDKKSTFKTEILAGLTTFITMAYIIFVNPSILEVSGIPKEAAIAATLWSAALCTLAMGLFAKLPYAVAPGMGINAFFSFYVCKTVGLSWQTALGAVFISGIVFLILTLTKLREKIIDSVPLSLKSAIVVGIGMFGGETRFNLPGSVGNTTSKFWDRGLANVALCDGPAGLRIQKRSALDKNGKIKALDMALSIMESFPGFVKKVMLGDEQKDTVLYQYTTAFPVANALAQTWNLELMQEVGNAIYQEMKEYGCTYWLAPAINIHRNPLCGRNFEYFSEDPRLSGLMAAAITRGVQQEDGYYVTVKHFACNNQEENRNKVSSNLSERALREIYLRGFETAVREGGAKAIMTSYNKVNGVYTPNSLDLCTNVLRCEWGFDGVVMTDWFSTNKNLASNAICMKVGNDLIMPGGISFKKEILQGVQSGMVTQQDVRRCCSNVVKSIFDSATQREYIG